MGEFCESVAINLRVYNIRNYNIEWNKFKHKDALKKMFNVQVGNWCRFHHHQKHLKDEEDNVVMCKNCDTVVCDPYSSGGSCSDSCYYCDRTICINCQNR
eukprot:UN11932